MQAGGDRFESDIFHQYRLPLLNPVGNHIEKVIVVAVATVIAIWEDQASGRN